MTLDEALRGLGAADPATRLQALDWLGAEGDASSTAAVTACLRHAEAEVVARAEAALWRMWCRAPDHATAQRFAEGLHLMEREDWLGAVTAFTAVIEAAPTFAEGWNKRATARYLADHYALAIEDCAATVRLMPQHFGALAGQGLCHAALGQSARAVACFREALRVHPRLDGIRARLQRLELTRVQGNGH